MPLFSGVRATFIAPRRAIGSRRNFAHGWRASRSPLAGRLLPAERCLVHIADAMSDPEYGWAEVVKRGSYRTLLGVPLLREGVPIGVIGLGRTTVSHSLKNTSNW